MGTLAIVQPLPIMSVTSSRGSGAPNLLTVDPKDAWIDSASGSAATLVVDLGRVSEIDTVFLGYVRPPTAAASWSIAAGVADATEIVVQTSTTLRVPDAPGDAPAISHALWRGPVKAVRYLSITLLQPGSGAPLTAGVLVVGKAFIPGKGQEWGAGRQPIDTGVATALASGGFATVAGAKKLLFSWTFGDLSDAETERLETIALDLGETSPGLVIEDATVSLGLRRRLHYGLFKRWRAFERRNRAQTRWEVAIEQWI